MRRWRKALSNSRLSMLMLRRRLDLRWLMIPSTAWMNQRVHASSGVQFGGMLCGDRRPTNRTNSFAFAVRDFGAADMRASSNPNDIRGHEGDFGAACSRRLKCRSKNQILWSFHLLLNMSPLSLRPFGGVCHESIKARKQLGI